METLFRLMLTRPAVAQREETPSIPLVQETPLQAAMTEALQAEAPREALRAVARQFLSDPSFVGAPSELPVYDRLRKLRNALDELQGRSAATNAAVAKVVEESFGAKPSELVRNKTLDPSIAALKDSLLVIKQLPEEHRRPVEDLTNQLRDLEVVREVAADKSFPGDGATLRRFRRRSVRLPEGLTLPPILSTAERRRALEAKRREEQEERRQQAESKLQQYQGLERAVRELTALGPEHLETTTQQPDSGFLPPATVRPVSLFIEDVTQRQRISQPGTPSAEVDVRRPEAERPAARALSEEPPAELEPPPVVRWFGKLHSGSPGFAPAAPGEATFRTKASAEAALSASTQELLRERGVTLAAQPLDQTVEQLRAASTRLGRELDVLLGRPVQRSLKRVGGALVLTTTALPSVWNSITTGILPATGPLLPADDRVPHSHGDVAPAGVADLLVVKQQLVRYEGADVGHIENVLRGEKKEREHSRRRETEELLFRETEITTSEERELESTSRFEMTRETSETISEDASLKAGLTVSGKYGPTVEFSASAEGSLSRSKQEATSTAATFAQDVTERSARKVTERVLERSSLRVTNEVIEKNLHGLDNTDGQAHISGVYQWVSKVYQAQMFNYGLRMIYDFMVPEPGALLVAAMQSSHASAVDLEKPTPFPLRPDQIDETNYFTWVHQYRATDVQPPPELYRTKSWDFKAGGGDDTTDYTHSGQVQIDDGYRAVHGTVGALKNLWEASAAVDVVLGTRTHRFAIGDWLWSTTLADERDSLPFAVKTKHVGDVAIAGEVKCQRTDRALLRWQHETHAKITQAYQARLAEYEEKLAALEVQAGVPVRGRNPAANQQLMRDEFKRNCVSILTDQHFDLFDAITTGATGLPELDLFENEAEGPYVRFFEQAFEWEQLTWVTYPYFWGSKDRWPERIAYDDPDPVFNQFLQAGYCRVSVPVRPGFEGAVDHFLTYGEIWNGGPLPPISNPLYLPIADEIAERLDRPGAEEPQGDPWLVRVPTTLVRLRRDDKLPVWTQKAAGEWVEQ